MNARTALLAAATGLLSGCSITQHVTPIAANHPSSELCIIESPEVRQGFLEEFRKVVVERGYKPRMLPEGSSVRDCPTVATYIARWSWDLTIYMSYAKISVFRDDQKVGEAVYDATKGGGRLDKFINAEPKIRELVEQLFPVSAGSVAATGE